VAVDDLWINEGGTTLIPRVSGRVRVAASVATLAAGLVVVTLAGTAAAAPMPPIDTPNATSFSFGSVPVGGVSAPQILQIKNTGGTTDDICNIVFSDPSEFFAVAPSTGCYVVTPGGTASIPLGFIPSAPGLHTATATVEDQSEDPPTVQLSGSGTEGYYETTSNGAVSNFGDAVQEGDPSGGHLNSPIVGMASFVGSQPNTGQPEDGYWLVAADGGIFNYGAAGFFGSAGAIPLNKPIVGMASTRLGNGYWLVASDGGIFTYGQAHFYGSTGSIHLNQPIVGMAATPDAGGYWLVASDGGIFSYGDAQFYGSTGSIHLNQPIVGMAATPDGRGYWLVAADGGIFSYGDAHFYGSTGSIHLNRPIVGMAATPDGGGYWFVASDGGIFNYGDAGFYGSTGGGAVTNNVTIASTGGSLLQDVNSNAELRGEFLQRLESSHAARALRLMTG